MTASRVDIRRSDKGIEGATAASVKAAGLSGTAAWPFMPSAMPCDTDP